MIMNENVICRLTLLVLMMLFLVGCSVKEQRDDCPCRLVLDFSQTDVSSIEELRVSLAEESGQVYEKCADLEDFIPEYVISAPREELSLMVCSDDRGFFDDSRGMVIPYGRDCPRLYMYCANLDCRDESVRDTVHMNKNHCVVDIFMDYDESFEYRLCVKGNVDGYGLDGRPHKGQFSYSPSQEDDGGYEVSLPRQVDTSLLLEIDDGTEVLKTFSLGEYIKAGGYDWSAPDLEDLTVHVNWAVTTVSISVSGWNWVYECEIVI